MLMEHAFLVGRRGGGVSLVYLSVVCLFGLQWFANHRVANVDTQLAAIPKQPQGQQHRDSAETILHHHIVYRNSTRMTSAEFQSWIRGKKGRELNRDVVPHLPWSLPRPQQKDTIRIYNATAWQQLEMILTSEAPIVICANGGSVTAGGGTKGHYARYFRDFVAFLRQTHVVSHAKNITILDRGHGARGSLHTALVAQNYFPPETIDVLLWEFSINDAYHFPMPNEQLHKRMAAELMAFETWLKAVSQINPQRGRPPLVILVYLWTSPFQLVNDTTHIDHVFESHQNIGAKYDFVVGYANAGLYVEELQWGHNTTKELLIADAHHPNRLGHAMIGFLLLDFVQPNPERLERAIQDAPSLLQHVQSLDSDPICHHEGSMPARTISKLLTNSKLPVASWTMDYPHNTQIVYPGMLTTNNKTHTMMILGKQEEYRSDRQKTLVLPCCSNNSTTSMLEFSLYNKTPMAAVQAVSLGMRERPGSVMVFLDNVNVTDQQVMVYSGKQGENCLGWGMGNHKLYVPWYWVLLSKQQSNVTTVRLCSPCGNRDEEGLGIGSLSVY